jgi:hypothetical protein
MVSSGMFRRVALVRTDVSEELSVSFIRATQRKIPEETILYSHRHENLKSDITVPVNRLWRLVRFDTLWLLHILDNWLVNDGK